MTAPTTETVRLRHCDFEAKVKVAGIGSPVVYLHTAGGPRWDTFLDALAEHHTVYAPDHPGTGETDRDSIHQVDTLLDLTFIKELAVAMADSIWALGTTGKFIWPIPDKGLKKRLHRITAATLIIWGAEDSLIPPVYAQDFAAAIADSRVEIVPGAGHVPQWEQLDAVKPLVLDYLKE